MKRFIFALVVSLAAGFPGLSIATTLADWTFETNRSRGFVGAGQWATNIAAEIGSGTASAWHAASASKTDGPGNGSVYAFGFTNGWSVGDCYQFATRTTGYKNLSISFDETATSGASSAFSVQYSTDGASFHSFGGDFLLSAGSWHSFSYDLSSVSSLNDSSVVYLRLVDDSNQSIAGDTVSSYGYSGVWVDNVIISAQVVPEPSMAGLALVGMLGWACVQILRKKAR